MQTPSTLTVENFVHRRTNGEFFQLVDVRTEGEYRLGHLPEAVNIPLETLSARMDDVSDTSPVVLVCQKGGRAMQAFARLSETHPSLLVLEGGTEAWILAGKPLVKLTRTGWSIERQIRLIAGFLVFVSTAASFVWRPAVLAALFLGAALTVTALINWCGLGILLAKMPWNNTSVPVSPSQRKAESQ